MIQSLLQSVVALKVSLDDFITFESAEFFTCERYMGDSQIQEGVPYEDYTHTIKVDELIKEHISENDNKKDDLLIAYKIAQNNEYLFCITDEDVNVIDDDVIENKIELENYLKEKNITGIFLISKKHFYYDIFIEKINKKSTEIVAARKHSVSSTEESDTESIKNELEEVNHIDHLFKDMIDMEFDEKDVIEDIEKEFVELPTDNIFNKKIQITFNEFNKILINNLLKEKKFTMTKEEFDAIRADSISTYMKHLINYVEYLEPFFGVIKYLRSENDKKKRSEVEKVVNIKSKVEKVSDILITALQHSSKITFSKYVKNMHEMLKAHGGVSTYTMLKCIFIDGPFYSKEEGKVIVEMKELEEMTFEIIDLMKKSSKINGTHKELNKEMALEDDARLVTAKELEEISEGPIWAFLRIIGLRSR